MILNPIRILLLFYNIIICWIIIICSISSSRIKPSAWSTNAWTTSTQHLRHPHDIHATEFAQWDISLEFKGIGIPSTPDFARLYHFLCQVHCDNFYINCGIPTLWTNILENLIAKIYLQTEMADLSVRYIQQCSYIHINNS